MSIKGAIYYDTQKLGSGFAAGASTTTASQSEFFGIPEIRWTEESNTVASGYVFGNAIESASDGILESVSIPVSGAGPVTCIIGRVTKDGHFTPRTSFGLVLVVGTNKYPANIPILKGECLFVHIPSGGGLFTYKATAPKHTYFGFATASAPTAEIATLKSEGSRVSIGMTVSAFDAPTAVSDEKFGNSFLLPSGWTLAGNNLTAGGASGDTTGRRCYSEKRFYSKRRAYEFSVDFNAGIIQFGFATIDAWTPPGTTVGIDPNGRAMVLYGARSTFDPLVDGQNAVIPASFDFGTRCNVRMIRWDKYVTVTITDANGISASLVSPYPVGDYSAEVGDVYPPVYSKGWMSDRPFFTWFSSGSGPVFLNPKVYVLGASPFMFLGDSITEGYGTAGATWAEITASQLGIRPTVLARSGCKCSDLLQAEEIQWLRPLFAIVSIGANTGNTTAILGQLVDLLRSRGAISVILCRFPKALNDAGNIAVDDTATAKGLVTPPQFDVATVNAAGTALELAYSCGDDTHPNDAGQSRMAKLLIPILAAEIARVN